MLKMSAIASSLATLKLACAMLGNGSRLHARAQARALKAAAALLTLSIATGGAFANIAVSSSGQASTGYPVAVPPGISGMAPNLSLSYSDGGINGPVGVGWSVQGISMITRCPATVAVDLVPRGVEFRPSDKLCLDGQRLIQTDAAGLPASAQTDDAKGVDGPFREYRTEKDSFARIRAYGAAGSNLLNGPAYFKVWTKSGQIYEYGRDSKNNNSDTDVNAVIYVQGSSVVAVWAVRRVYDVVGNYMHFKYFQRDVPWGSGPASGGAVGHEWNLAEVQYTGTATQVPHNKVLFEYEDRAAPNGLGRDSSEAYQWSNKNVSVQRLKAITTYVNSPNPASFGPAQNAMPVRVLKLAYENSPVSGRSRLVSITPCAGTGAPCMPATTYAYRNNQAVDFTPSTSFLGGGLSTLPMLDAASGNYGVLTGDFDGDGRTDILRWSNTPTENQLWLSRGSGTFIQQPAFNIASTNFFITGGCYTSIVADFNGDGLSDILRVSCTNGAGNRLFISMGDGSFTEKTILAGVDLSQQLARYTPATGENCAARGADSSAAAVARFGARHLGPSSGYRPPAPESSDARPPQCISSRSIGTRYYILDLNGDGLLDIVTTVAVPYSWNETLYGGVPDEDALCAGQGRPAYTGLCSRVFLGQPSGDFQEKLNTNIARRSLYSDPPKFTTGDPYWKVPDQADINGDGLQDILSSLTGRWRSMGDGNFETVYIADTSQLCGMPIDFNGDGRTDCLVPSSNPAAQRLTLSYKDESSQAIAQFNLNNLNEHLYGTDSSGGQNVGAVVEDFDGDGRQDILRWGPTGVDTRLYLSNGDGSFRATQPQAFQNLTAPLQSVDGTRSFILGDFLGVGSVQILRLKSSPSQDPSSADTNQLYVRNATIGPVDVLERVTSPTGLVAKIDERLPLPNSNGRYITDRGKEGLAAIAPLVDLQPPVYVITAVTQETGGNSLTTQYQYKGLKAERGGRGLLGFREFLQQNPSRALGLRPLTIRTEYLLRYPYTGAASRSESYLGTFSSPILKQSSSSATIPPQPQPNQLLSTTVNKYCDKTSTSSPEQAIEQAPCMDGIGKVARPYLYNTVESGLDLNGAALPTVTTTNTYNSFGDPLGITVLTRGLVNGVPRDYTKTTTNEFCEPGSTLADGGPCPNRISGDDWVLGRLTGAKVRSVSPNLALTAANGGAPQASAVTGVPPAGSTQPINPAVLAAILQLLLED